MDVQYTPSKTVKFAAYLFAPLIGNLTPAIRQRIGEYIGRIEYSKISAGISIVSNVLMFAGLHFFSAKYGGIIDPVVSVGGLALAFAEAEIRSGQQDTPAGLFGIGWFVSQPLEALLLPDNSYPTTPEALHAHMRQYQRNLELRLAEAEAKNRSYIKAQSRA